MTSQRRQLLVSVLIAGAVPFGLVGCTGEDVILSILGIGSGLCETDARCNDGLFCNGEEFCLDGLCKSGVVPCDANACDENANVCSVACTDEGCDDGSFCNGEETCRSSEGNPNGACVNGPVPCFIDEICRELSDKCVECVTRNDCSAGHLCIDDFCIVAPTERESFTVQLRNEDIQTTHILTAAESFGPTNRLSFASSRAVQMPPSLAGDVFTFRAGRNQIVFATVNCVYFPELLEDAVVTWNGLTLTCSGELTPR